MNSKNRSLFILAGQIVTLVLLVLFMWPSFSRVPDSPVPFSTMEQKVRQNLDAEMYPEQDQQAIRRYLGLSPDDYADIAFFRTDSAMDADELVLVRFKNRSQADGFKEKIQKRIDAQTEVYEGYAPEQTALMKRARIELAGNYALYIVGENANQAVSDFKAGLEA